MQFLYNSIFQNFLNFLSVELQYKPLKILTFPSNNSRRYFFLPKKIWTPFTPLHFADKKKKRQVNE